MAHKYNNKNSQQHSVTTRFPLSDYSKLLSEAEQRGTTLADMLRICWAEYQSNEETEERLQKLESRIFRRVFEVGCATQSLTNSERQEALSEIKSRLRGLDNE